MAFKKCRHCGKLTREVDPQCWNCRGDSFEAARVSGQEAPKSTKEDKEATRDTKPTPTAEDKGRRLETDVRRALSSLRSRFPTLVDIIYHPKVILQSQEYVIPDFSLTLQLPFAKLHYFIECQDRNNKSKDILHKIHYVRDSQWRKTFIFVHRGGPLVEPLLALKRAGVIVFDLGSFRLFLDRIAEVCQILDRVPEPGIPDQGMLSGP